MYVYIVLIKQNRHFSCYFYSHLLITRELNLKGFQKTSGNLRCPNAEITPFPANHENNLLQTSFAVACFTGLCFPVNQGNGS